MVTGWETAGCPLQQQRDFCFNLVLHLGEGVRCIFEAHTSEDFPSLLKEEQVAAASAILSLSFTLPAHTAVSNISNACRESHVELPVTPQLQRATHTHTHTQHGKGCTPTVLVSHHAFLKGLKPVFSEKGPLQRLEDTIKRHQLQFFAFTLALAEVHEKIVCKLSESLLKDSNSTQSFSGSMLAAACTPLREQPSPLTRKINKERRQEAYLTLPLTKEPFSSPSPASSSARVCGSGGGRRRRNRQE